MDPTHPTAHDEPLDDQDVEALKEALEDAGGTEIGPDEVEGPNSA